MDDRELDWNNYNMGVNLYRSYLDLVIKINLFYYAITGAIVSYYFAHSNNGLVKYSLLLPILMSILFAAFFIYSAVLANNMRNDIRKSAKALGFDVCLEARVLVVFLYLFALLFISVFISLGFVFLCK